MARKAVDRWSGPSRKCLCATPAPSMSAVADATSNGIVVDYPIPALAMELAKHNGGDLRRGTPSSFQRIVKEPATWACMF